MSVNPILREWFWRIKQINDIDDQETVAFGNVSLAIERFKELATFIQAYLPTLREWMLEYLNKNRSEIFIRYWGEMIHSEAMQTHPSVIPRLLQAKQEWDSIFGKDPALCTALSDRVVKKTREMWNVSHCDDSTILALHEGKEHHRSCEWFDCDYCEEQERAWHRELMRRMTESSHPLLNPKRRTFLSYHFKSELNEVVVQQKWEPPRSTEPRKPFPEVKLGQTIIQRFRALLPIFIDGWSLGYEYEISPYKQFFQLWNTLDRIMDIMRTDLLMMIDLE